ncbi:MAG TPA: hypothetical protein EYG09_01170 [Dehalococcoidia bacterium]|nr:hypothetical protein [Dehalococcoidia bacterium]
MTSGGVTVELGSYGQPFEEEEFLLLDEDRDSTGGKVLRDQNLDALVFNSLVSRYVGFLCISVDRHRGVTTSAE